MNKKIFNNNKLITFSQSIDLCLITLQTFDLYSYNFFFEELQKIDKNNYLLFIILNLRLKNQINFFSKNPEKKKITKFLKIQSISSEDLLQILLVLSKVLNSKFCKQKFHLICLYFLPEYSIFNTASKSKEIKNLKFFNFWIINHKNRFHFFFLKIFPRRYTKKICNYIIMVYLQNGLRCLNFYRNL